MTSKKLLLAVLILIAFTVVGSFFLYLSYAKKNNSPVQKTSQTQSNMVTPAPITKVQDLLGKSDYVSFVNLKTKEGTSKLGYVSIKGYVHEIDKEKRGLILAIDFDKNIFVRTSIRPDASWAANISKTDKDYFYSLQKMDYISGACGDEHCTYLSGVEVRR